MPCNVETLRIEGETNDMLAMSNSFKQRVASMSQTQPPGAFQLADMPAGSRMPKPFKKT